MTRSEISIDILTTRGDATSSPLDSTATAISETIDWARSLVLLHANELDARLVHDTLNVLLKYEEDIIEAEDQMGKLLKLADVL